MTPYHATMVRRWHTNPALSHTVDPVGYHGGRMAVLAIMLWPGAMELLEACITHDLGECASGDVPWGAKQYTPLKDALDDVADAWSMRHDLDMHLGLGDVAARRLKFLDRADAYLWMLVHARRLRKRQDWKEQRKWLKNEAAELGVAVKWAQIKLDTSAV